jgi:hypothetical protein
LRTTVVPSDGFGASFSPPKVGERSIVQIRPSVAGLFDGGIPKKDPSGARASEVGPRRKPKSPGGSGALPTCP